MIKLNLLPGEFKKKKIVEKPKKEKRPTVTIKFDKLLKFGSQAARFARVFLVILIGAHFLLGALIFFKAVLLKKLDLQWQPLQPKKAEMEKINLECATLEKIVLPVRQLVENKFLWSKKLNQISDLMIPGVWLNRLVFEEQFKDVQKGVYKKALILEGCAVSSFGEETALIGKFIKVLQEDKEFFSDFSEIKSGPLEKAVIEKTPIMYFRIFCILKKG
ncbi:MAG: hypothetical protein NC828_03810 [Candidatus Omnitrophica bacterium]|nr:hypothetical protein [Candidatus Omnitrophota bacterium]